MYRIRKDESWINLFHNSRRGARKNIFLLRRWLSEGEKEAQPRKSNYFAHLRFSLFMGIFVMFYFKWFGSLEVIKLVPIWDEISLYFLLRPLYFNIFLKNNSSFSLPSVLSFWTLPFICYFLNNPHATF